MANRHPTRVGYRVTRDPTSRYVLTLWFDLFGTGRSQVVMLEEGHLALSADGLFRQVGACIDLLVDRYDEEMTPRLPPPKRQRARKTGKPCRPRTLWQHLDSADPI